MIGPVRPSLCVTWLIEVHSSLGQTSALHVSFVDQVVVCPVYGWRNTDRTVIVKRFTENLRDWTLRTLVNQGYGKHEISYCKEDSVERFSYWSKRISERFTAVTLYWGTWDFVICTYAKNSGPDNKHYYHSIYFFHCPKAPPRDLQITAFK